MENGTKHERAKTTSSPTIKPTTIQKIIHDYDTRKSKKSEKTFVCLLMQFKKPAPRWNTHNHNQNQNHIHRFLCSCWQQRKTRNRRLLGLGLLLVCVIVVFATTRHGYASIQNNNNKNNKNNKKKTTINKNNKIPSSTTTTTMKKPKIIYVPIPESDTGVLRFAAQKQVLQQPSNDDDGRKIMSPVTIQEWANLMAHEDRIYAQELALDLTTVLKVSSECILE